jgi:uncharacterized membrane protein required for colicin V production
MADLAIITFWLFCTVRGVFRGPVVELFSIVGTLCGLVVAGRLYLSLSAFIPAGVATAQLRRVAVFLLVLALVYVLLSIVGVITRYLLQLHRKGWLIRLSGASLGMCKGVLLVAVLLIPLIAFFPQKAVWFGRGTIFAYEERLSETIVRAVPGEMKERFQAHINGSKTLVFRENHGCSQYAIRSFRK